MKCKKISTCNPTKETNCPINFTDNSISNNLANALNKKMISMQYLSIKSIFDKDFGLITLWIVIAQILQI